MTRHVQTNFTAADFIVGSVKDKPAEKSKAKTKAAPEKPKADPNVVPDGTTEEVLDWVGDDRDKAERALAKEREDEKPRVTLVEPLEKIIADDDEAKAKAEKKASAKKAAAKKADSDK